MTLWDSSKKNWWGAPSTEGRAIIGANKFDKAMNSLFAAVSVKPGFHLIVMIAVVAEKSAQLSDCSVI